MGDIEKLIIRATGITQGAVDLAEKIYALQDEDPNVERVKFSRHSLPGYSGAKFLIANIDLKEAFADVSEFKEYLVEHDLPVENISAGDIPRQFGFLVNAYLSDAFCAYFYQPAKERQD